MDLCVIEQRLQLLQERAPAALELLDLPTNAILRAWALAMIFSPCSSALERMMSPLRR